LKTLLLGASGAILYPLVPTTLQALTRTDWSGWKGLFTGVGLAAALGLATGRPEITVGAMSAMGTHLLYAKGTGAIENFTGTQIFRMNPNSVVYAEDLQKIAQGEALSDDVENNFSEGDTNENSDYNPVEHSKVHNFDALPPPTVMAQMLSARGECQCDADGECQCHLKANIFSETETSNEGKEHEALPHKTDSASNELADASLSNYRQRIFNNKKYYQY
jgi:hypothetical protein